MQRRALSCPLWWYRTKLRRHRPGDGDDTCPSLPPWWWSSPGKAGGRWNRRGGWWRYLFILATIMIICRCSRWALKPQSYHLTRSRPILAPVGAILAHPNWATVMAFNLLHTISINLFQIQLSSDQKLPNQVFCKHWKIVLLNLSQTKHQKYTFL